MNAQEDRDRGDETIYSEIWQLSPASQIVLPSGRRTRTTRESDNPMLSLRRASYKSASGDSGIQEDDYENFPKREDICHQFQVENASTAKDQDLDFVVYTNMSSCPTATIQSSKKKSPFQPEQRIYSDLNFGEGASTDYPPPLPIRPASFHGASTLKAHFQSDLTAEIGETMKDVYREMPMRQRFSKIFRNTLSRKKKVSSKLSASVLSLDIVLKEEEEQVKPKILCVSQESHDVAESFESPSKIADSSESLEGSEKNQNVESIYANGSFDSNELQENTVISDSSDLKKLCEESKEREVNDAEKLYSTVKRPPPPRNEYSPKKEYTTECTPEQKASENVSEELGATRKPLQNEVAEPHKEKEKRLSLKNTSKIFRNTLTRKKKDSSKLSASMLSLDIVPKEEEEQVTAPLQREVHRFVISYLCSAVVKPPLKAKHVEKCLKQYQKEVGKKQKITDISSLGNKLLLQIITDEGITMADIRNPNAFKRHFPISTIDSFITHPENPDCFAFSTTAPGDEQHKYHVFYKARENASVIKEAFDHLKQMQRQF